MQSERKAELRTPRTCPICGTELPEESPQPLCQNCLQAQTRLGGEPLPRGTPAAFTSPDPEALRSFFPQLELLGLLGVGGMGAVYRARQRGLDRLVALKILSPRFSGDPAFAERFAREARMLAKLNHPNIVDVYDLGQAGPYYYFLMELVDGVSLRQMMQANRPSPQEALAIVPQICEALEYAHGEGIVHRDIKPENILLDQRGRVKIADFGVSKLLGSAAQAARLTQSNQVLGSLHYMAPEQFEDPLTVDHRADLYSLGVVLYELLTGELPLGRFAPPSHKAAVDAGLDELVLHALEKDRSLRCQRASELRTRVEEITGVATRLSPEVSRKLSFEYRSKATILGWPLLHIATGVDSATGRKRSARGILAVGTSPRGLIAFGDVAVGVIACGIFCYGPVSIGVVAVGMAAMGSVALGAWWAVGGVAIAPVAIGGAVLGYYASGALAWGQHVLSPEIQDPMAQKFFDPWILRTMRSVMLASLICLPVFLALGFVPALMAKRAERRRKRRLRQTESSS